VNLDGRPVFRLAGVASTFPAAKRAVQVAERLEAIAEDPAVDPSTVRAEPGTDSRRIVAGTRPIVLLTEPDAATLHVDLDTAAGVWTVAIREAIARYRAERQPASVRAAALRTGVAVVVTLAALLLVWFAFRRLDALLERRYHHRIRAVGIQSLQIVRAERIRDAIRGAFAILRFVAVAIVLFAVVDYGLAQFPWTRASAVGGFELVVGPLRRIGRDIMAVLPNIAFLVVLLVLVRLILRIMRLVFDAIASGRVKLATFDAEWAEPTYKLLRLAVVAFALIVAYPYIPGSSSDAFKGISLFVGLVFSLASTTVVANLLAGYALIYRRAFKVGDRIKTGDIVGVVTQSTLQSTHVRTSRNEDVIVPNSQLLTGIVINYSALAPERGLLLTIVVGIGYETPWRQVEAMLLQAAERTPNLTGATPPHVIVPSLGDFAVNYELRVAVADARDPNAVRTALAKNVLDVFNEHGVQIMTPAYEGDPKDLKVVKPEDWFLPPALPASGATRPAGPNE
jgi:small-conductance mechanosensitive channel